MRSKIHIFLCCTIHLFYIIDFNRVFLYLPFEHDVDHCGPYILNIKQYDFTIAYEKKKKNTQSKNGIIHYRICYLFSSTESKNDFLQTYRYDYFIEKTLL